MTPRIGLALPVPRVGLAALLATVLGTCLAMSVLFVSTDVLAKVRKGDRIREFVGVTDKNKKAIKLKAHKDKVVVVTFGASWCAPCKKELPALEKIAQKFADSKASAGNVVIIAVNIDSERSKGAKFMKEAGLSRVIQAFDTKKSTVDSFDPPSMPTTFVIRKGIVRHMHKGYRSGDDKALEKVIAAEVAKL